MNTVPTINNKEELAKTIKEYRKVWKELQERKESGEPSIDHWRLTVAVQDSESVILEYLRNNDI